MQRCSLSPLLFNLMPVVLANSVRQEKKKKEKKSIQTGKEEVKMFYFAEEIISYAENTKNFNF